MLTAKAVGLESKFDVLVTDFHLPDGDGIDVARALGIPICLALTGSSADADTRRLTNEGFAAILVKPVVVSRLVSAIQQAVSSASTP